MPCVKSAAAAALVPIDLALSMKPPQFLSALAGGMFSLFVEAILCAMPGQSQICYMQQIWCCNWASLVLAAN